DTRRRRRRLERKSPPGQRTCFLAVQDSVNCSPLILRSQEELVEGKDTSECGEDRICANFGSFPSCPSFPRSSLGTHCPEALLREPPPDKDRPALPGSLSPEAELRGLPFPRSSLGTRE